MSLAQYTITHKMVPLLATDSQEQTIEDATSFRDAGFPFVEIVCRAPNAVEIIAATVKALPDLMIGAGTVLSVDTAERAIDAGVKFLVSPAFDPAILEVAQKHGIPLVPGVCSPSDVAIALRNGCIWQKLFPANLGGLGYLDALASPFGHTEVRLIASCGVTKDNYVAYLKHRIVGAIIPDWLSALRGKELREEIAVTQKLIKAI